MKHFNPALTARAVGTWRVHSVTRHVYQRGWCMRGSKAEFNKQPLIQLALDAGGEDTTWNSRVSAPGFLLQDCKSDMFPPQWCALRILCRFQEGGRAAADLCGAPTAVPTPPWSFLKPLCLLIVARFPSSVPRLCVGTAESALEGR